MTDLSEFILNAAVEPYKPLTTAEHRVADLVARGWASKHIASRLNIKTSTVQHHIENISAKLPNDDLPARERVQIWALCQAATRLARHYAA